MLADADDGLSHAARTHAKEAAVAACHSQIFSYGDVRGASTHVPDEPPHVNNGLSSQRASRSRPSLRSGSASLDFSIWRWRDEIDAGIEIAFAERELYSL